MRKAKKIRTGIYCGSFNPVHKGHIQIARAILDQDLADEVWIVATGNYWDKQDLMPLDIRIALLKHYEGDGIVIDQTYNGIEKTYAMFRQLKEDHPDRLFYLVLGADNVLSFERWVNYKELLENPFIVIPRDETGKEDLIAIMEHWDKTDYAIVDLPLIPFSSTYIREHMDDYDAIAEMMDRDVYDDLLKRLKKKKRRRKKKESEEKAL